jgi:uncharacterized protein
VAAWNGLAIAALAEVGTLLDVPSYVDAAVSAADLLLDVHFVDGRLRRTSRDGKVGANAGVLEDYADVAEGLLALHQATGAARWLDRAGDLLDVLRARFGDGNGGFYDTADDAEALVRRPWDPTDGPVPSGTAAAAGALLGYAALTGQPAAREAADAVLATLAPVAAHYPRAAGWACATAEAALAGPLQVAVALPASAAAGVPAAAGEVDPLLRAARLGTSPGTVVVAGAPDTPGIPLLASRPLTDGAPTAYVCRGFVCDRPTTDPAAVAAAVRVSHPG